MIIQNFLARNRVLFWILMIENFNPFISLGGDNQKVNHMAEAALEMNLTCNDLKKDLNLTDGDVVDMLQLVMDRFKNSN